MLSFLRLETLKMMAIPHPHPSPSKLEPMDWLYNSQPTDRSVMISLKKKDTTDLFRFQGKQIIILSAGLFTHQVMKMNFKYSNALVIIQCSSFDKNLLNHRIGSALLRQCLIWATKITLQNNRHLQFLVHAQICLFSYNRYSDGRKFKYDLLMVAFW